MDRMKNVCLKRAAQVGRFSDNIREDRFQMVWASK